jgi:hypothetical protein
LTVTERRRPTFRERYAFGVNFGVARNPDPDSRLPYLVRLPIDGGLILKVRDTWPRERYPHGSSKQQATTVPAAFTAGDYAVRSEAGTPVAVVERKSLTDLAGGLSNGTLVVELAKLTEMPRAAVVVGDRYGNLLKHADTPAGFLPDMLARVRVRYPEISIVFLETRPVAEEWTFRCLGAALAEFESEQDTSSQMRVADLPLDDAAVRSPRSRRRQKAGA